MTGPSPTFGQVRAQVAAVREKYPEARVIGIRSSSRWSGDRVLREAGQAFAIYQCDSPLAMRFALRDAADEDLVKVLVTPLEDADLSSDITLRLAKRQLFPIKPWQIVRTLFNAQAVDPRLTRHGWIAELLLELIPSEGYPPARGGFLDAEAVWPLLLRQAIDMPEEDPDLTSVLKWAQEPMRIARFRHSSGEFRAGAIAWLTQKAGVAAEVLLRSVLEMEHADAIPVGLAAGVVYHPAAAGKLDKATGKMEERYFARQSPSPDVVQRWSAAATEVARAFRHTDPKLYRQLLNRADEILGKVQADDYAHLSDTSEQGFDQRVASFGRRLGLLLESGQWDGVGELEAAARSVGEHDKAVRESVRLERIAMALRLVRWLTKRRGTAKSPTSLAEASDYQLTEGGFIDWARLSLWHGDPIGELSAAYSRLFDEVRSIREEEARSFARLLADWTAAGSKGDDVVPVERILEVLVAPLAAERPVLLIVVDGMSAAVCRELLDDLTRHDWVPLGEPGRERNRPGLAVIPSVTEFSRTSLLCGRPCQGHAADEAAGFAEHPALLAQCRSGSPPVLFHKAGLQEADEVSLAKEVRSAIQSAHRRVVGVIVNAVDDHLAKGDQIDVRWSRDRIKVLPAILHEARVARRLVILVSDHGHVVDCQTKARGGDAGERHRTPAGKPGEDELLVEGSRVLTQGNRLIAPVSERIRYGNNKKNGYHGGLTPQEMVVPIVVLSSTDDLPGGWHELPIDTPDWWDEPSAPTQERLGPVPDLKPAAPKSIKPSGTLFDPDGETESTEVINAPAQKPNPLPEWVSRLLTCEVFEDQRRLGGRTPPSDEVIGKVLAVLDERGGKLRNEALARSLQFPLPRLWGLLAQIARVLNVDGYDILRRDDASETVELDRDLLLKQFDLTAS